MTTARTLADEGTEAVLAADVAVHRNYSALIREAVEAYCSLRVAFHVEMVRDWIGERYPDARPHHCNVLGAVFRELANAGRIRPVGWTEATRPESRGRALRIWRAT